MSGPDLFNEPDHSDEDDPRKAGAAQRALMTRLVSTADPFIGAGFAVLLAWVWLKDPENSSKGVDKAPALPNGHLGAHCDRQLLMRQMIDPYPTRGVPVERAELVIGFVPGSAGYGVLDFDVKDGKVGKRTYRDLVAKYGEFVGAAWRSISRGVNVLFLKPVGAAYSNYSLWEGVDVRCDNGWVVAAGSVTSWGDWVWKQGGVATGRLLPEAMTDQLRAAVQYERAVNTAEADAFIEAGSQAPSASGATAAFGQQRDRLKQAGSGSRHDTLASVLGWVFGMEHLNMREAIEELWDDWVAVKPEAHRDEIWNLVSWVVAQEKSKRAQAASAAAASQPGTINIHNPNNWTDTLLGQMLADELRAEWRYVTVWRKWVRWDGRRWAVDEIEAVHELARRWMLDLGGQVLAKVTTMKDRRLRSVLEYRRASAMENLVKVARRILAVEAGGFDRHAHLLNALNGVVDLRSGQLVSHDPALMMTRLAGAAYDPAASHADVDAVFGCLDPADVASMAMLLGVAATGHTGGDHLPVFDGMGSNGKTTLLLAASGALGDYAGPVPPELVMKSSREDHPTIKTVLHGRRLAYVEETEEDGGLRLERVKALTGGAPITGRKIGGDYYEFPPSHTLILATNHRPNVNSAEHAAWRRLHLIPFPHRYGTAPGDRPLDSGLRERLGLGREQREAMLTVIVAGAVAAYGAGEPDTPVVRWSVGIDAATDAWRQEEDVIWRFAFSELEFDANARTTLKDLFARYKTWCEAGNRPAGHDKTFARRFEAHDVARQVRRTSLDGRVVYEGVRLR